MLYKISKKTAGIGIILMNIFTMVIFLLVILKILPYSSIGGGRLESYQVAYQTAIASSFIMGFGIPIVAVASGLITIERSKKFFKIWLVFAFILIAVLLYQSAIVGVVIVSFGIPLMATASGLIGIKRFESFCKAYSWLSFVFICLNTIANLLGITLFEKTIMALVTVIQAVLFFRLATDKGALENTNLET
jgi:hypothetical protein